MRTVRHCTNPVLTPLILILVRTGDLLREVVPDQSIEKALAVYGTMKDDEIDGAAAFIRACLRLDYKDRASAKELEIHPWLLTSSCNHYH